MRPFRNNHKRMRHRASQDRPFKRSNDMNRVNSDFGNRENGFRRKNNRNNGNVDKLISKYNELAREALSNGDKILSENYLQHADHFTRILNERESFKREKFSETTSENKTDNSEENTENVSRYSEKSLEEEAVDENKIQKNTKPQIEAN